MDLKKIEEIKKIAIKAMFSDDYLMDRLVLKGGNALDLIYGIAHRSSIDLDFSMKGEFPKSQLPKIIQTIENVITVEFSENGYSAFDIKFEIKPPSVSEDMKLYWGGYEILFKVIEKAKRLSLGNDMDTLRRNAEVIGSRNQKTFSIDISRFEYCENKNEARLDELRIFIYSPVMIVLEKLRALCQQTRPYRKQVKSHNPIPRAKDFFDIYTVVEACALNLYCEENMTLLKKMFEIKRVPLVLLSLLEEYRELHRDGFDSLKDVMKPGKKLKEFDFYFDYVLNICAKLKSLGVV